MTDNSNLVEISVRFFKKLQKNNNKAWFSDHKAEYEREIKKPAEFFADILLHELEDLTSASHKVKIFRIYRDVRFSKDKTPYNTHLHIGFSPLSEAKFAPAWFLGISPKYFTCGCGVMEFKGQTLIDYRNHVAGPKGADLSAVLKVLQGNGMRVDEPSLKRVPAGFDKEHERGELLKHKKMTVWKDMDETFAKHDNNLVGTCMTAFKDMKPLYDTLKRMNWFWATYLRLNPEIDSKIELQNHSI